MTLILGAHWDWTGVIILISNHAVNREGCNKKECKPNCSHPGKETKSLLFYFVLLYQVTVISRS